MQRFFLLLCVILGLAPLSRATVVAKIHGDEPTFLKSIFASAERSIFIRCASISDKSLVDALLKARKRGVVVRIIVDEPGRCLPGLLTKVNASFIKVAGRGDRGKGYYTANQSSAYIDSYGLWYGVKHWEASAWTKRSTMISDRYGADPEGKRQFEVLWKRTL